MCTVTFIPTRYGLLFSSSRDESPLRKKALFPVITRTENGDLIYPTDGLASGTWVGVHNSNVVVVLLNGAANSIPSNTSYSRSRGLVAKQLLISDNPHNEWDYIELANVASFTLVVWHRSSLFELTWNGQEKHCIYKNSGEPHIWSSSTLYDINAIKKREQWFTTWLNENKDPDSKSLYQMLRSYNDNHDGFVMNRKDIIRTLSISLIEISFTSINFKYFDLITSTMTLLTIDLKRKHETILF